MPVGKKLIAKRAANRGNVTKAISTVKEHVEAQDRVQVQMALESLELFYAKLKVAS